MNFKKYFSVILLVSSFLPFSFASASGSAAINVSPISGSYKVGQTFNLFVSVDPGSEKIDTVRAKISFPADLLEIKNFIGSSMFSFQAGSNGFDNSLGTFSWGAGVPGGITTANAFGTIIFSVKKAGSATVAVSADSLALSAGENKFSGKTSSAVFSLLAAAIPQKPVVKKIIPVENTNVVPVPVTNNTVETQIVAKNQPQNFAASLMNSLPFLTTIRTMAILGIILIIMLLGFTFYKILEKPLLNLKNKK